MAALGTGMIPQSPPQLLAAGPVAEAAIVLEPGLDE